MNQKIVQSKPRLLTASPVANSIVAGANAVLGPFDNSDRGDTMAHVTLIVSEPSSVTAGSLFYVTGLHQTPSGFESGSVNVDPSKGCIGAVIARGVATEHQVSFDMPIRRSQFKVLLQNAWNQGVDYSLYVETSSQEAIE